MKVYIDLIFIINYFFDLILLFAVSSMLRRNPSLKRILLGSLVGGISIFILFISINPIILFLIKILIGLIMVLTTFGYKDIRYTFNNLFYLLTTSIVLGGLLYLINIEFSYKNNGLIFINSGLKINFIFLLIVSPFLIMMYTKQIKKLKNVYSNYYHVDIYFKNGLVKSVTGFLDTGNNLFDPYANRPIILLNKKDIKFDYNDSNILLVPYDTLNNHGILKCIIPSYIHILGIGIINNVLIGVSESDIKMDGIDCILHKSLLGG